MVIHRLLDGTDGELQRPIPHLAGFHAHLGGFYVDELPFFKLADVFRNRVSAHACVLANPPDTGPALVGFSVLAEDYVGIDRQLAGTQSQGEDLIGQKKIMAQWASLSVSVFDLRDVTSKMFSKILHLCSNLCP